MDKLSMKLESKIPLIPLRSFDGIQDFTDTRSADSVLELSCSDNSSNHLSPYTDGITFSPYKQTEISTKWHKRSKHRTHPVLLSNSLRENNIFKCVVQAILNSGLQMASLTEIYQYIQANFPSYPSSRKNWHNNVRHILSINGCFVKGPTSKGHGHYWYIEPNFEEAFSKGDFSERGNCRSRRSRLTLEASKSGKGKIRKPTETKTTMERLEDLNKLCCNIDELTNMQPVLREDAGGGCEHYKVASELDKAQDKPSEIQAEEFNWLKPTEHITYNSEVCQGDHSFSGRPIDSGTQWEDCSYHRQPNDECSERLGVMSSDFSTSSWQHPVLSATPVSCIPGPMGLNWFQQLDIPVVPPPPAAVTPPADVTYHQLQPLMYNSD